MSQITSVVLPGSRRRRAGGIAVAAAILVGLLSACSTPAPVESGGTTDVDFRLNFSWLGQHLGIADAVAQGFWEDEGLNVTVQEGKGSQLAANDVAGRNVDFAIVDTGTALLTAAKGGDIISVANVIGTSSFGFAIGADTDIKTIQDLKGQSIIVVPGTTQANFLPVVLGLNGMSIDDVNIVQVDAAAQFSSFSSGVAPVLATSLTTAGPLVDDKRANIKLFWSDLGFTVPDYSIVTRKEIVEDEPALVEKLLRGLMKGWAEATANPEPAAEWITTQSPTFNAEASLEMWKLWTPLFCTAEEAGKPFGMHDPEQMSDALTLVQEAAAVETNIPVEEMYTNQFFEGDNSVAQSDC